MTQRLEAILDNPWEALTPLQRRRLKRLGPFSRFLRGVLERINRWLVPVAFNLTVEGISQLPRQGPYLIAPNHSSSLDSFVLAAVLPHAILEQTQWAGSRDALLRNRLRRFGNRLARAVPLTRSSKALAVGAAVLQRDGLLVWFPEGRRTRDGSLQKLKPGIGILAVRFQVPVVPVWIDGAFEALPPGHWIPRFRRRIRVRFGAPLDPNHLAAVADSDGTDGSGGSGGSDGDEPKQGKQLVAALRKELLSLRDACREADAA